ncbi:hypothetical protein ABK040_002173 [Willaertia magna]
MGKIAFAYQKLTNQAVTENILPNERPANLEINFMCALENKEDPTFASIKLEQQLQLETIKNHLYHNRAVTKRQALSTVSTINFEGNLLMNLTDEFVNLIIDFMPNIEVINLSSNYLDDKSLSKLEKLLTESPVKYLVLTNNKFSSIGELAEQYPYRVIYIPFNWLSGTLTDPKDIIENHYHYYLGNYE